MDLMEGMSFLREAMYGQPDIYDFWGKEAEQARREGKLYTARIYEEQALLSKQYQGIRT